MRLRTFATTVSALVLALAGATAASASVAAHPDSGVSTARHVVAHQSQPTVQPRVAAGNLDMAAVKASMAAHQGVLTNAEAKRLGLTPNTVYTDTPQARALAAAVSQKAAATASTTASRLSPVTPASHSGCNGDVCIEVTGKGLKVDKWYTAAYAPGTSDICAEPVFWVDGDIDYIGYEVCGTLLEAWDDEPEYFENHTQLCNTWTGVAGRPCATVHS